MGFHSFLQAQNVPFESALAKSWNMRIFKSLRRAADAASVKLAHEKGPCPDADDRGVMERFSHKLAIAPTASISIICGGTSAGIEPIPANIYTHKTLSGSFAVKNPYLETLLETKGLNTDATWNSILEHQGSVMHLDALSADEKDVFKTAFELDQRWVVELGRRPHPRHLPEPVGEPLHPRRRGQVGPAHAALHGVGARLQVAVLPALEERAARGVCWLGSAERKRLRRRPHRLRGMPRLPVRSLGGSPLAWCVPPCSARQGTLRSPPLTRPALDG